MASASAARKCSTKPFVAQTSPGERLTSVLRVVESPTRHAVLARLFGAQRLSFLETIVNEEVEAILDGIEQGGEEWNAVDDFAKPLPVKPLHTDPTMACRWAQASSARVETSA